MYKPSVFGVCPVCEEPLQPYTCPNCNGKGCIECHGKGRGFLCPKQISRANLLHAIRKSITPKPLRVHHYDPWLS